MRGLTLNSRDAERTTGKRAKLTPAEQTERAVQRSIDGFTELYRALGGDGSVQFAIEAPEPIDRFGDDGIVNNAGIHLHVEWIEIRDVIEQGNFDPVALRARIDQVLGNTLDLSAEVVAA